jgi:hypothetical protein
VLRFGRGVATLQRRVEALDVADGFALNLNVAAAAAEAAAAVEVAVAVAAAAAVAVAAVAAFGIMGRFVRMGTKRKPCWAQRMLILLFFLLLLLLLLMMMMMTTTSSSILRCATMLSHLDWNVPEC